MTASYEWDIETLDPASDPDDPEILDHDHRARLADFDPAALDKALLGDGCRLVLVRDADNRNRGWAYVQHRTLPSDFVDANGVVVAAVPLRFRAEFARTALQNAKG